MDPVDLVTSICGLLARGDVPAADQAMREGSPFVAPVHGGRKATPVDCMRVYLRDGFIDRYTGARLIHPAVLRLLSWQLPEAVPFHTNWKMSETHALYWERCPTLDHIVPVSRGGLDDASNHVTTSMRVNSAKGEARVEELGWTLREPGRLDAWDGLTAWLLSRWDEDPSFGSLPAEGRHRHHAYVLRWCRATRAAQRGMTLSDASVQ